MIDESDLIVSSYPDTGKGGQHVGCRYGVKVEHIPTGLIAICNVRHSQHKNKLICIEMIEAALTCKEI